MSTQHSTLKGKDDQNYNTFNQTESTQDLEVGQDITEGQGSSQKAKLFETSNKDFTSAVFYQEKISYYISYQSCLNCFFGFLEIVTLYNRVTSQEKSSLEKWIAVLFSGVFLACYARIYIGCSELRGKVIDQTTQRDFASTLKLIHFCTKLILCLDVFYFFISLLTSSRKDGGSKDLEKSSFLIEMAYMLFFVADCLWRMPYICMLFLYQDVKKGLKWFERRALGRYVVPN